VATTGFLVSSKFLLEKAEFGQEKGFVRKKIRAFVFFCEKRIGLCRIYQPVRVSLKEDLLMGASFSHQAQDKRLSLSVRQDYPH
jgi:hypothetical protein